jgi:hypothetical protein
VQGGGWPCEVAGAGRGSHVVGAGFAMVCELDTVPCPLGVRAMPEILGRRHALRGYRDGALSEHVVRRINDAGVRVNAVYTATARTAHTVWSPRTGWAVCGVA